MVGRVGIADRQGPPGGREAGKKGKDQRVRTEATTSSGFKASSDSWEFIFSSVKWSLRGE